MTNQVTGKQLFDALNAHIPRSAARDSTRITNDLAVTWETVRTFAVTGDQTSSAMLIACCAYTSTVGKILLSSDSRTRLNAIVAEAQANWLNINRVTQLNANMAHDLYNMQRGAF